MSDITAQLQKFIDDNSGSKCEQVTLWQAAGEDKCTRYLLGPSFLIAFLIGPGLGIIDIGINYCISFTSGLFAGVISCYIALTLLVMIRLVLEFRNTLFCKRDDALWIVTPVFVMYMNLGGMMSLYVFYTWCHNLFAFAGSALCGILFLVFYFVCILHHHNRFCIEASHSNKAAVYQKCDTATQVIDFLVLISTLAFYVVAFWLDDQLNFDGRPANKCLLIPSP